MVTPPLASPSQRPWAKSVWGKGSHVRQLICATESFSAEERLARIEPDFQAIAARLQDGGFLFGTYPTAADASVGAVLGGIAASPTPTPLSKRVREDVILSAYLARCKQAMGA